MDALHRLVSGVGSDDADNSYHSEDDDDADAVVEMSSSDFRRATTLVAKEGLREGLAHGKEVDMQKGFNEGYRMGVEIGMVVGAAKALLQHPEILPINKKSVPSNHLSPSTTQPEHLQPHHLSPSTQPDHLQPHHLSPSPTQPDHLQPHHLSSSLSQPYDLQSPPTQPIPEPSLPSIPNQSSLTPTLLTESPEDPGVSSLTRLETDLQTLETFLTKKLVPDPNDSCCGGEGGDDSGNGCCKEGDGDGDDSGGGCCKEGEGGGDSLSSSTNFFRKISVSKDQRGKAEDCLIFAHRLRHRMKSLCA